MVALANEFALKGHHQLAEQAAMLVSLMRGTLAHYQDHAKEISAAAIAERHVAEGRARITRMRDLIVQRKQAGSSSIWKKIGFAPCSAPRLLSSGIATGSRQIA
jgi:hypothetical protein